MKTLIATAIVALSLLSTAISAQASYANQPDWVQKAFENLTN